MLTLYPNPNRTMDTGDLEDELDRLDKLIRDMMDHLRGAPAGVGCCGTTQRIYSLPISLGGCGLANYAELREAARSSCRERSQHFLLGKGVPIPGPHPLVEVGADGLLPPLPTSQKVRAMAVYKADLLDFLKHMTEDERTAFHDNGGQVGSAWLHAIPSGKYRALTDRQVAVGLNVRCLKPDLQGRARCRACGNVTSIQHFECCTKHQHHRVVRHTIVMDAIQKAVVGTGRIMTREDPANQNVNNQRTDGKIRVAGGGEEIDQVHGNVEFKVKVPFAGDTVRARKVALENLLDQLQREREQRAPAGAGAGAGESESESESESDGGLGSLEDKEQRVRRLEGELRALEQEVREGEARAAAAEEEHQYRERNGLPAELPADQDPDPMEHAGAAENAAEGEDLRSYRRAAWVQIAAALEVMVTQCRTQYRGLEMVPEVVPLVVSSGGALHRDMVRFMKRMLPDPDARRQLRVDMSLALLRGRAGGYDLTLDPVPGVRTGTGYEVD